MSHCEQFLELVAKTAGGIDSATIDRIVEGLVLVRKQGGRLFCLGAGGSAANCSHFVNDVRKLCDLEAYCPTDNAAELTARVNDEGWDSVFVEYLKGSRVSERDALFILSVGGGDLARHISVGLIKAIELAKERGAKVFGVVGRENCYTKHAGDAVVVVRASEPSLLTPMAEAFQSVICHAIVSDPRLLARSTTW